MLLQELRRLHEGVVQGPARPPHLRAELLQLGQCAHVGELVRQSPDRAARVLVALAGVVPSALLLVRGKDGPVGERQARGGTLSLLRLILGAEAAHIPHGGGPGSELTA